MPFNDFGEVQTLFSIFTQASLIFSAINIVTVVLVSTRENRENSDKFIFELQKLMIYLVGAIGLAAILFSPYLKSFFNFQSIWPFIAMVFALLGSIPIVFWNSYLQGKEDFVGMNLLGVAGAGGRLLMATLLVILGFGSFGAIIGLFAGQLLALVLISRWRNLPPLRELFHSRLPNWPVLKLEMKFTALVFVVSLMITMLYSGDILIVKHYQNPDLAGAYAGVSSIARMIFFVTLPFAMVLLPAINSNREKSTLILKKSLFLVTALGGASTLIFWGAGSWIIKLMIGERYAQYAYLLPKLTVAIFLISIANLLIYYLLSIRNILSLWVSFIGLAVFVGMSVVYHESLSIIVNNLLISSLTTVILLVLTMSVWPRVSGSKTLDTLRRLS